MRRVKKDEGREKRNAPHYEEVRGPHYARKWHIIRKLRKD